MTAASAEVPASSSWPRALFVIPVIAALLCRVWVVACLWDWFVAGPFRLPVIGVNEAFGLTLLATFLARGDRRDDDAGPVGWSMVLHSAGRSGLVWLAGWLVMQVQ